MADCILASFEEAGHRFEIVEGDGPRDGLRITAPDGTVREASFLHLDELKRMLRGWFAKHSPDAPSGTHPGLVIDRWNHGSKELETVSYPTRLDLVDHFYGAEPDLEWLGNVLEEFGSRMLRVRRGDGTVLMDRRETLVRVDVEYDPTGEPTAVVLTRVWNGETRRVEDEKEWFGIAAHFGLDPDKPDLSRASALARTMPGLAHRWQMHGCLSGNRGNTFEDGEGRWFPPLDPDADEAPKPGMR